MRFGFLLGYDGERYFGYVRQPGKPTVEEELLKALRSAGVIDSPKQARYRVAARTDRNVSAIGQVTALDTLRPPDPLQINKLLPPDIALLAVDEVEDDFDPRTHAINKHYRYVCETPENFDLNAARKAAELLEGKHDFTKFCKIEPGRPTVTTVRKIIVKLDDFLTFDFVAPVFLRQQVRRMVTGILKVGKKETSLEELKLALEGKTKHSLQPAPPDGLFLVSVMFKRRIFSSHRKLAEKFLNHLQAKNDLRSREMARLLSGMLLDVNF
ncbi:MAG: tRNA pseudouridine(38-40) synthase TruA [Candidatus Hadarchaeales archaeon]